MVGGTATARRFNPGSQDVPCGDGTLTAPRRMWPPNHKLRDIKLTYAEASDDGDTIGLTVDAVTHEEEGLEKGATARPENEPDFVNAAPSGTAIDAVDGDPASVTLQLRSERMSKPRDGRTYDLTVTCSDSGDVVATAPVHVFIKALHSRRR
jgi:hypothetical protein